MKPRLVTALLLLLGQFALQAQEAKAADKEVSFKTEDGWTIYGSLSIPENARGKVPVVVLLPSIEHDRAAFGVYRDPGAGRPQYPGIAPVITARGVATLTLDLRGRGKSVGKKEMHSFSPEEMSKIYLDVEAALGFISSHPGLDVSRTGIIAAGTSAEAAITAGLADKRVQAISLLSGRLSESAKGRIASSPDMPLLLVVSSEDRPGFRDMTDAYFLSKNSESDIEVYNGLGIGTWMLSMFRQKFPNDTPLHNRIGEWVADQLLAVGTLAEVSFQTSDGWTIHGNLRVPQGGSGKLPAVVLAHSGLSDRYAYHDLEIALARENLVVLNIDWRGRGKSTGKGKYFELTRAERDKGHLDVLAAVNYLASLPGVDASRIGVLGTIIGARYAMAALAEDPRIKTGVVLTGYIPTEKEKTYLTTQNVPVLYITSAGHRAVTASLKDMYNLTRDKGSELIVMDGGAIGYQLFELDETLLARVVGWMKDKLKP
ncbi:MAG TPA: alpha/beta hydrolase [Blastocatellia bacterium]|nr:alpha/beta hydrolase [Blastocatellia bacterium]